MQPPKPYPSAKVAIVGAGCVGSTTAYALMLSGTASHIAIIDVNKDKAQGEMLDLAHCMQFTHSVQLTAGDDFALVQGASIVIICAGVAQKPGQTRTQLLETNVSIFKELIAKIIAHNNECIIIVVTNPLDVLTYVTWKVSGLPACRVFGTGTVLDSARLRYLIGQHLNISPKDVTAHILGEHGDSEFAWWSKATVAGIPLNECAGYDAKIMHDLYLQAKNAAYDIIAKKGATFFAIALVVTKIVRAIVLDQSRVFAVSTHIQVPGCTTDLFMSVPTVIRQSGVCEQLKLDFDQQEQNQFLQSAQKIAQDIQTALKLL